MDLCELLKGHEGETFYSPFFGKVKLVNIYDSGSIRIKPENHNTYNLLDYNGKAYQQGECMLFPSKDQRDWNKWTKEQKPKTPKTWDELQTQLGVQFMFTDCIEQGRGDNMNIHPNKPIEKSALALLKIHQLIEVSYGGNITHEEWYNKNNKYIIIYDCGCVTALEVWRDCDRNLIAFHTKEQAYKFISYPENVQLVKDFYMIN